MTTRRAGGRTAAPTRRELVLPETVTVKRLAEMMNVSPVDVIKQLMRQGVMATINQAIDYSIASLVTPAFGYQAKREEPKASPLSELLRAVQEPDPPETLQPRPPVVTILGHVDHGKTTLLDAIRETHVAEQEVGGITQHIGAYQVQYGGQRITFIDTPGHEAFTAMRARGAQVTDIAVLVVAADDGVMPQTVEALNHARAAGVPIMVAINKVDKPEANVERVKRQLGEQGLVLEEWGGDTIAVPVSAKARIGIDELLENLLVLAEVLELKANPQRPALGVVLEARMDKSRGPLATVLVQRGTLRLGDVVVAGVHWGRVKAMLNDVGRRIREAGPSSPVEVLGLGGVPEAGDIFMAVADDRTARDLVAMRLEEQEAERTRARAQSLEEVYARVTAGELKQLSVIIKTDVQGSVDAIRSALEKVAAGADRVKLQILHAASGSINESDVLLASASKAIIMGFNTRVEPGARRLAEAAGVDIRLYDIIYQMVEDVERAVRGALQPTEREVVEGHAEVRAVFPAGRGKVAGCYVRDGRVLRNALVRVQRDGKVIHDAPVSSLRRFKEDVTEVAQGFECGIGVEGFNDFQEGDILEVYRKERPRAAAS